MLASTDGRTGKTLRIWWSHHQPKEAFGGGLSGAPVSLSRGFPAFLRLRMPLGYCHMPIYEYELEEGQDCSVCGGNFTLRRPLSAKPLTQCPLCKKAVKKLISGFSTPSITKPLSISDAKKAGFTVLKKTSKGEYERQ
ncbi:MAG: FmdB family zinc ribbon protein [Limisphaerales bacterium]